MAIKTAKRRLKHRGGTKQVLLAFDMDETIGNVWQFFPIVDVLSESYPRAYREFVKEVAKREQRGDLGLLRPGLLDFFHTIAAGQQDGTIAPVVLYSNNSALEMLHFTRDVLHEAVGRPTIEVCLHWGHPLRRNEIVPNDPGNGRKTWTTLAASFRMCGVEATPSQTLFFDDQPHPDLMDILQENYIHVSGYSYKIPNNVRTELLVTSLEAAGVAVDTFQADHAELFKESQAQTRPPPHTNKSIGFMKESLHRLLDSHVRTHTSGGFKRKRTYKK